MTHSHVLLNHRTQKHIPYPTNCTSLQILYASDGVFEHCEYNYVVKQPYAHVYLKMMSEVNLFKFIYFNARQR